MRREERQIAVEILYGWDLNEEPIEDTVELYSLVHGDKKKVTPFTFEIVNGVAMNKVTIDELLQNNLSGWSIKRLNKVDLAIFRSAIYEMFYMKQAPQIVINEALEITRNLSDVGDEKAVRFNNKVLDNIAKNERG